MKLHVHWFKPAAEVRPPYALAYNGIWGWQQFSCRCGAKEDRYKRLPPVQMRRRLQ